MKLDKLRWIYEAISIFVSEQGYECRGYYLFEKWFSLSDGVVSDTVVVSSLARSVSVTGSSYRAKGSSVTWFHFQDLDFSISIDFAKALKSSTRVSFRKKIDAVYFAALNEYRVAHNPLTGLLAKDAFAEALAQTVSKISGYSPISADAQESILPRAIAVFALDIDYFKQVNDTWGHYYGDQVLKAFGRRLAETALDILNSSVGSPEIHVGHPSGEEFLIAISANANKAQFYSWASLFRAKIADELLPTDEEWAYLTRGDEVGKGLPPLLQERAVTTSVGVTLSSSISRVSSGSSPIASLLDRADTALYKAKAAGRNQVIFYDEILTSCGRVLEHDSATGVVAIDIGANVGVTVGQEFKVFPTAYTGKKKFTVNDGRTTKTLGFYPKVESGRIIVFDTQPEISFACLAPHYSDQSIFEVGSSLEAVPAGSIKHLLPNFSRYFPVPEDAGRGDGVKSLQEYLKDTTAEDKFPFAIVVRFSREDEYSKKYGPASLNYALARLFKSAQSVFHAARFIEVLDRASICIVGENRIYKESVLSGFAEEVAGELHELGVLVGVFCQADSDSERESLGLELDHSNALDFARFAASELGRDPVFSIRHFNYKTARDVMQAHRDARAYKVAYADYEKLLALGVIVHGLENLAGLMASAMGENQLALKHYETAFQMSPNGLIYKSNFCTAAVRLDADESALVVMNALPISDVDTLETLHIYGYYCYTLALAKAKIAGSNLFDQERFLYMVSKALLFKDAAGADNSVIERALAMA